MKEGTQKLAWRLPAQSDCSRELEAWPSSPSKGGKVGGDDQRPSDSPGDMSVCLVYSYCCWDEISRGIEKREERGGG